MLRNILTASRKIACTPFKTTEIQKRTVHGFTTVEQHTDLTALTVVYPSSDDPRFKPGQTVWLKGSIAADDRFSYQYEIEQGKPFVLLPIESILVMETEAL